MGRGDKKTKKGKIAKGSYGNNRRRNSIKAKLKRAATKKPNAVAEAPVKAKRTNTKKKAEA
jgi:30S ribosomal protein S31